MNTMDKQVYLNNKGSHCPYCCSQTLTAGELKYSNSEYFRQVICLGCGNTWTDIYRLADIEEDGDQPSDKEMAELFDE